MIKEYKIVIDYDTDNAPKTSTRADEATDTPTSTTAEKNALEPTQARKQQRQPQAETEKSIDRVAVAKTAIAYTVAATSYAADLYVTHQQTTHAIQGNYLAAENLGVQAGIYREAGNVGLGIGMGFAFGGLAGGAAVVGALALNYAKKALELAEQQRAHRADGAKQQFDYSLARERMVRSYVGRL